MDYVWIVVSLGLVLLAIYHYIASKKEELENNSKRFLKEYENSLERTLSSEEYESLSYYFQKKKEGLSSGYYINDDTANDLDFDLIYSMLNNTNSSVGREVLYALLRIPSFSAKHLSKMDETANFFMKEEEQRLATQQVFTQIGYTKNHSVYETLEKLMSFQAPGVLGDYLGTIALIASIVVMLGIRADVGLISFLLVLSYQVIRYFQKKAVIFPYLDCVRWLVRLLYGTKKLNALSMELPYEQGEILKKLYEDSKEILPGMFTIACGADASGSLLDSFMDYVRIVFHVDLIHFSKVLKKIQKKEENFFQLYEALGYLECGIATAAFRNKLPYYSFPDLTNSLEENYRVVDVIHPLVKDAVANSMDTKKSVLLTGSNASGKSTFLKAIALNALLSQSLATSPSREYHGCFYRMMSSMSHRDAIASGDSYYMVEIKALKQIVDAANEDHASAPLLCFLDEVLRGTNTMERIAASGEVLRALSKKSLCFAATHDIELTTDLSEEYSNYHFEEGFVKEDIHYSYEILPGPATSRNAIKLLAQIGFDEKIVDAAWKRAQKSLLF
ncbi:MAG: hypothetical protein K6C69_02815 [Lachnospiraceae bacterium]|nr:hypothetical protein [Lachnospiraceae bacterium]